MTSDTGQRDEDGRFEGHQPRDCGEHRTVGPHRARCFDCAEWCYPQTPCRGCEAATLRQRVGTADPAELAARLTTAEAKLAKVERLRQTLQEIPELGGRLNESEANMLEDLNRCLGRKHASR